MTINIETDIDEQIRKCSELLTQYAQLEQQAKKLQFITINELAEMLRLFTKYSKSNF